MCSIRPSGPRSPVSFGAFGGTVSTCRTRTSDHADALPAASTERTCQYQRPSGSGVAGDHVAWAPFASHAELPFRTTPRQSASEQTRNSTLPVTPNDGSLYVAPSSTERTLASSSGRSTVVVGTAVSSWKLCVALQPETFPAASCARTCQL